MPGAKRAAERSDLAPGTAASPSSDTTRHDPDLTGEHREMFSRPIGQPHANAAFDIVQRDTTSELPIPRVRGDQRA